MKLSIINFLLKLTKKMSNEIEKFIIRLKIDSISIVIGVIPNNTGITRLYL